MAEGKVSPSKSELPVSQSEITTTRQLSTNSAARLKTSVHVTAIDGIVTVNSLFTIAIFIGLSLTSSSSTATTSCIPGQETIRLVILFEIISFSCFLFSSLIAQSLKLAINLTNALIPGDPHKADVDSFCMKYGLLASAIGSVLGCVCLTVSLVFYVQVKLGVLGCGGEVVYAVAILVVLVGTSLAGYVCTAVYVVCFM